MSFAYTRNSTRQRTASQGTAAPSVALSNLSAAEAYADHVKRPSMVLIGALSIWAVAFAGCMIFLVKP